METIHRWVPAAPWLGPCKQWTGPATPDGYGSFRHAGGTIRAHLFALLLVDRRKPPGWFTDHLCHSYSLGCNGGPRCWHRRCVNPAHLEYVTASESGRRQSPHNPYADDPDKRVVSPKCRAGHPYLPGCFHYAGHRRVCHLCAGTIELSEDWRDLAAGGWLLA